MNTHRAHVFWSTIIKYAPIFIGSHACFFSRNLHVHILITIENIKFKDLPSILSYLLSQSMTFEYQVNLFPSLIDERLPGTRFKAGG